jgi:lipoate---protein ligase
VPAATSAVRRTIEVFEPSVPALVLGSTQSPDVVDTSACDEAGVEVVRRRSGGGAVLVDPATTLWVDAVLPAGDELWVDDVGHAGAWLGAVWAAALRTVGAVDDPVVHEGAICLSRWGRLVCFAGLGPGEVTVGRGGPKVVGVSQRRTRSGARFQCAVPFAWRPEAIVGLLRWPSAAERAEALVDLSRPEVVYALDPAWRSGVLDAFLAALPD